MINNKDSCAVLLKNIMFGFTVCTMILALFFNTELTYGVREAIKNTVNYVIPALFPFMLLSRYAVAIMDSNKEIRRSEKMIFGIELPVYSAVLIGFVSGFPVGGYTICEMYDSGQLSKSSAERALAISHNTGPAFCINVIGAIMWNSISFGLSVYISQIISWLIVFFLFMGKAPNSKQYNKISVVSKNKRSELILSLANAVTSSAFSCVNIAAFIIFWKMVLVLLNSCVPNINGIVLAFITSICEFSEGSGAAANFGGKIGAAITGFSIGFGGLSAIMQVYVRSSKVGLSLKKLVIFKITHGIVAGVITVLAYIMFYQDKFASPEYISPVFSVTIGSNVCTAIVLIIILLALIEIFRKHSQT